MQVTLFTKRDCSLCETLKADLLTLKSEIGFVLVEVDVEQVHTHTVGAENNPSQDNMVENRIPGDSKTQQRYRNLVPVLDIEDGPVLYAPIGYDELFEALELGKQAGEKLDHA